MKYNSKKNLAKRYKSHYLFFITHAYYIGYSIDRLKLRVKVIVIVIRYGTILSEMYFTLRIFR